ncbi:hypothetical protein L3Y34_018248 [Caenorhabditis briggsae]|uniref:F-box associated domain-containing protein n=1 Tax=Caenorhabditis briggsae TaxID=6238 RepID=A0AAE9DKC3_CAEBR|nr:hypothetical protein L3Y34_018248 [Caenorhabditis briggsae]
MCQRADGSSESVSRSYKFNIPLLRYLTIVPLNKTLRKPAENYKCDRNKNTRRHCRPNIFNERFDDVSRCSQLVCCIDQNFLGRNIRLQGVTLTNQDLLQLLDKWISNEAYHNLETLTIYVDAPNTLINEDLIRQTIAFEEYDTNMPEKRPDRFIFDVP